MMQRMRLYIVLLFAGLLIAGCERDFNERTDSNRSNVTFRLTTKALFTNLFYHTGGGYKFNARDSLKGGENLLIRAYCYNHNDIMVASYVKTFPWRDDLTIDIHWDYLWRTIEYHVVFLAEIVNGSDEEGYFESWFCMATDDWNKTYLYCDEPSNDIFRDALYKAETDFVPNRDTIELAFSPYTYNAYVEFTNIGESDTIITRLTTASRVRLRTNTTPDYLQHYYTLDNESPRQMITMPLAEDTLWLGIYTLTPIKRDTMYYYFWTRSHDPYVVTIDAQDLEKYSRLIYN